MDDIQIWLYILFAVIYFISRGLKKKDPNNQPNRPQSDSQTKEKPQRKPVSFEELLREFTEGKEEEKRTGEPVYEDDDAREESPKGTGYQSVEELEQEEEKQEFEEGKTRRFSDEESRRIYEESVAQAEGSSLEVQPDEDFRSSLRRKDSHKASNALAGEIRDMLSDPDDVKKAVVLSEILNRKY